MSKKKKKLKKQMPKRVFTFIPSSFSFSFFIVILILIFHSQQVNGGEVDVFSKGESGYYCIKIPDLLITSSGVYIAFGEGRMNNCSDYTWTDLVYKRSFDGGNTWSSLSVLYSNSSSSSINVIGNAAPVEDKSTGRIIVPFCRNNLEVLITYSEDDGATWTTPSLIPNVTLPGWEWIGTGPPSSIQLTSGRILTPAYHSSYNHYTDGLITNSHVMFSDDGGDNWTLGGTLNSLHLSNECQAVELYNNGTIFINSRSLLTHRLKSISYDSGETFGEVIEMKDLIEPLGGCEGSTIIHPLNNWMFFSIPNNPSFLRENMTVFISEDYANSWNVWKVINEGRSGYSALAVLPDNSVGLLYEKSTLHGLIFVPTEIAFDVIWYPSNSSSPALFN